jgi:membrane protease YdiL (CAAX protease family)
MSSAPPGGSRGLPDAPPWGIFSAAVAFLVGMFFAVLAASIAVSSGAGTTDAITNTVTFLGEWVGFAGVPVWLSRTRGTGRMSRDFGLRLGGPADLGLGLGVGVALYLVAVTYGAILGQFDHANLGHEAQQLSGHSVGPGFIAFALCAAIGAPIAEELFFRGLTQRALQLRLGGWPGLIAAAALFGLVHLSGNPFEAVPPLALVGLATGLVFWRTGRLGPGIIAHMTFNGITVVALAWSRM